MFSLDCWLDDIVVPGLMDAVADEAVECVMIAVCAVVGLFLLILGHTYLRTGTLFLPALKGNPNNRHLRPFK